MGDANDLNWENVSPENVRNPIIKELDGSLLPKEKFVQKLEGLVGQKTISKRRIWHLVDISLKKEAGIIDPIINYFPSVEEGLDIAQRYFKTINYSETQRGYVKNKPNTL